MKKLVVLSLALLIVFATLLTGCSGTAQPSAESEGPSASAEETAAEKEAESSAAAETGEKRTIGTVVLDGTNPHCTLFEEGFRSIVEDKYGDEAIVLDAVGDPETLINCISDLMSQQVDGIVLEACDDEAPIAILKEVKAMGIPVAAADMYLQTTEDEGLVLSQTISQNYEAGVAVAEDLIVRAGGEEMNVCIMEMKQNSSGMMRIDGFVDTIAGHDNIKILEQSQPSEDSVEAKLELAEIWVQKYDNIDAIFAYHDVAALAAVQALKAANMLDGVLVYGVDGSPDAMTSIKNGEMTGTSKQQPDQMAISSAEDVYTVLNGGTIDHEWEVYIPTIFVDASNVDEYL